MFAVSEHVNATRYSADNSAFSSVELSGRTKWQAIVT